jgi:hypothetical protein
MKKVLIAHFKISLLIAFIFTIGGCDGDKGSISNPVGSSNSGYSFTASASPSGAGAVSRSPSSSSYEKGTEVTVKGTPTSGYAFKHWILQDKTYSANPLYVTVNSSTTITAVFEKSGSGSGSSGGGCITFECPNCNGTGKCRTCAGRGYTIINGSMVDCRMCSGTGKCWGGCYGKGTITRCD